MCGGLCAPWAPSSRAPNCVPSRLPPADRYANICIAGADPSNPPAQLAQSLQLALSLLSQDTPQGCRFRARLCLSLSNSSAEARRSEGDLSNSTTGIPTKTLGSSIEAPIFGMDGPPELELQAFRAVTESPQEQEEALGCSLSTSALNLCNNLCNSQRSDNPSKPLDCGIDMVDGVDPEHRGAELSGVPAEICESAQMPPSLSSASPALGGVQAPADEVCCEKDEEARDAPLPVGDMVISDHEVVCPDLDCSEARAGSQEVAVEASAGSQDVLFEQPREEQPPPQAPQLPQETLLPQAPAMTDDDGAAAVAPTEAASSAMNSSRTRLSPRRGAPTISTPRGPAKSPPRPLRVVAGQGDKVLSPPSSPRATGRASARVLPTWAAVREKDVRAHQPWPPRRLLPMPP